MRWQVRKGGRVMRSQGGKRVRVVKWQGGGRGGEFLVLLESGGHRVSPRFHFLVSDVDQQR